MRWTLAGCGTDERGDVNTVERLVPVAEDFGLPELGLLTNDSPALSVAHPRPCILDLESGPT